MERFRHTADCMRIADGEHRDQSGSGKRWGLVRERRLRRTALFCQVDENLFVDEITMQLTGFKKDERAGTVYMKEPYLNPLGYAKQGVKPQRFMDIGEDHPYAEYIYGLQSLGFIRMTHRFRLIRSGP